MQTDTDRQIYRPTDREAERQTYIHTSRQTDEWTHVVLVAQNCFCPSLISGLVFCSRAFWTLHMDWGEGLSTCLHLQLHTERETDRLAFWTLSNGLQRQTSFVVCRASYTDRSASIPGIKPRTF